MQNGIEDCTSDSPSTLLLAPAKSASEREGSESAENEVAAEQHEENFQSKGWRAVEASEIGRDTSKRDSLRTDQTRQPTVAASQSAPSSASLDSAEASDQSKDEEGSASKGGEEIEESQKKPNLAEGTRCNDPSEGRDVAVGASQGGSGTEEGSDSEEESDSEAKEEEEAEVGGDAEPQPESSSKLDAQSESKEKSGSEEEQASGPARDLLAELDEVADLGAIQKPGQARLQESELEDAAAPSAEEVDVIILGDTPPVKCR